MTTPWDTIDCYLSQLDDTFNTAHENPSKSLHPGPYTNSPQPFSYVGDDGEKNPFLRERASGIFISLGGRVSWSTSTSSDLYPRHSSPFPSVVGRLRQIGLIHGCNPRERWAGEDALSRRGMLQLSWPMISRSYADLEYLIHHALEEVPTGRYRDGIQCPLLLAQVPFVTDVERERITQIFMETFDTPLLCIIPEPVLALVGTSLREDADLMQRCLEGGGDDDVGVLTTGLVIDIGATKTSVAPVVDGVVVASAFVEVPVGGDDLDELVWSLLIAQGHQEPPSATKKVCILFLIACTCINTSLSLLISFSPLTHSTP